MHFPVTADGGLFMIRRRFWRMRDPASGADCREALVRELMLARRAMGETRKTGDRVAGAAAKATVDSATRALGERGAMWWSDGAPDLNRHLALTTLYAERAAAQTKPASGARPTQSQSGR